jgi:hypothetical protein
VETGSRVHRIDCEARYARASFVSITSSDATTMLIAFAEALLYIISKLIVIRERNLTVNAWGEI